MKNIVIRLLILVVTGMTWTSFTLYAKDDDQKTANGTSIGFFLGQIQRDLHIGASVTSPAFLNGAMAVRANFALAYFEHIVRERTTWTPYHHGRIGIVGYSTIIAGAIRCYGEGGLILLFPSTEFSEKSVIPGGYGHFGFEFLMSDHARYFLEIGGTGTGATADRVPTKPLYSNGFVVAAGVRFSF
jgi:hypothetical protein